MLTEQAQFLDGVNRKDNKAWEELYRYFYAPLCSYSGKIICDADMAEDIVQGCFVSLWRSSFRFTDIKAITTYLYRSVYNGSLNFIRDRQAAVQIHQKWFDNLQVNEEEALHIALEEEAITRFYSIILQLPEQQREILLASLRGDKVKDIAERLSVSENTVKTHKKRAYQFIREQLGDSLGVIVSLLFV
jgi:RNA polymerase sigma factor, sigma-70 family